MIGVRESLICISGYHRIPDRESVKTVADLPVGSVVEVNRLIRRCGYQVQGGDMPIQALNREAIRVVAERSRVDPDTAEKVIGALGWWPRGRGTSLRSTVADYHFDPNGHHPPLRWVYRKIRGEWLDQNRRGRLRTLWYATLKDPVRGRIVGKKMRQIGLYCSGSYGSYWDPYDYEPPYLDVKLYQQVYELSVFYPVLSNNQTWASELAHPLDVKEIKG